MTSDDDTPADLWANRFVPGTGWTGAARLDVVPASDPGRASATWGSPDPTPSGDVAGNGEGCGGTSYIGAVDPARTLEITNAVAVDRQYAVTTAVPGGRYSQVKLRASVRASSERPTSTSQAAAYQAFRGKVGSAAFMDTQCIHKSMKFKISALFQPSISYSCIQ